QRCISCAAGKVHGRSRLATEANHVDDCTTLSRNHARSHGIHRVNICEIFRVHSLMPGFRIKLFPRPAFRGAGAVDEHVDWPKQLCGALGCALRVIWITEVGASGNNVEPSLSKYLTRCFEFLFMARSNSDTRAFPCKCACARQSDTLAAASDKDDFSFQAEFHAVSSNRLSLVARF